MVVSVFLCIFAVSKLKSITIMDRTDLIVTINGKEVVMTKDRACCCRHIWVRVENATVIHLTENLDKNLNLFVKDGDDILGNGMSSMGELMVDYDVLSIEHLKPYLSKFL